MRKTFIFTALFFFLFSLFLVQCTSGDKALHKQLNQMAVDLNISTPVMLDQYTRFDSAAVSENNEFQYYYTIMNTNSPDSLISAMEQTMEKNIHTAVMNNPDLRIFRDNDITLQYFYRNADAAIIHSIIVTPDKYK
ncbi:MAG: hypothetical protein PHO94_13075 [Petrimonas sp.]|nr:hypothetical protein [Petrimonas sp.]